MQIAGLKCFSKGRSTGRAGCKFMPGVAKMHVLVPYDWSLDITPGMSDDAIVAALVAAIVAGETEDVYASRFQPIGRYISFDDKSEAPTVQSFNLGSKSKVNDGVYIHEYTYDEGGLDQHIAIRSFDGKNDQYKTLIIDSAGVVYSTNKYDESGALTAIQGIELSALDVYPFKSATYPTEAEFRVGYTYANASELNEDLFAIKVGSSIFSIIDANRVIDLVLIPFTATGARVHPFIIETVSGSINVADTLGAALEDPTAIVAVNKTSGVSIAVTSIALNALTKKYVVTFTAGSGYVATQVALVKMGSVSALEALDAEFYDGSTIVEITMA